MSRLSQRSVIRERNSEILAPITQTLTMTGGLRTQFRSVESNMADNHQPCHVISKHTLIGQIMELLLLVSAHSAIFVFCRINPACTLTAMRAMKILTD